MEEFLNGGDWDLVAEFTEVESGGKSDRPELEEALKLCKRRMATLVIAKLDRLARNVHFISGLMECGVKFCAVEFPNADPFMLHVHAAMGEHERRLISQRTKAGLERAKARGVKLEPERQGLGEAKRRQGQFSGQGATPGDPQTAKGGRYDHTTTRAIAAALNDQGIKSARGGQWHPQTVSLLLKRIDKQSR